MPPRCETCNERATLIYFAMPDGFDVEHDEPLRECVSFELACDVHEMQLLWCEVWEWHAGPDPWRAQALDAGRPDLVAQVDRALGVRMNGRELDR